MDIFSTYAVDESKEENGAWIDVGDASFLIARAGNKRYVKLLSSEVERNSKALDRKDDAADALSDRIMITVLAETILLGWKGVSYRGVPMEYSKENARTLLAHKEFRRQVMKMSDDFGVFRAQDVEDAK